MFSEAKAAAYGILALVVLSVIGYFIYSYDSTQKENKTLQTQVTVQKVEIKDLGKTVEVTQKAGQIDDQVTTARAQQTQRVEHTFNAIQRKADAKIEQIHQQSAVAVPHVDGDGALAPAASAAPTEQDNQISQVRIEQLWESYCVAAPTDSQCQPEKKQ